MTISIGDYAFLSDCQTGALVSAEGSIDWYCPRKFDAPSVFGRLLGPDAGFWSLRPAGWSRAGRNYLAESLVLRTVHVAEEGAVEILEALALGHARGHAIGTDSPHVIVRIARGLVGNVPMRMRMEPRFEYGLTRPRMEPIASGVLAKAGPVDLSLLSSVPVTCDDDGCEAAFTLRAGTSAVFSLSYRHPFEPPPAEEPPDPEHALSDTLEAWESWAAQHGYEGEYQAEVRRTAVVLQGLTYQPSGGVVAAPTTSLPEVLGGEWNWDYRYAWLRDASLMMRAEWVAACPKEPERFFRFIGRAGGRTAQHDPQIMYGITGERDLTEHELEHLPGFADSRPVRVGNAAWRQRQLDVLGEVLDAAHLLRDQLGTFDDDLTDLLHSFAERAAVTWREPDHGMWEARDGERHYLSSKVMCWVALDRAVKLASHTGATDRDVKRWAKEAETLRETVLREGFDEEAGAFTGAFGSKELDASVLVMPLFGFLSAEDPRMRATIETVERTLGADGLVRRWASEENGFLICSFWLVECLALAGMADRAKERMCDVLAYGNDLGLLAEMGDPKTGLGMGNYPQAFSHVGLANAAWTLTKEARKREAAGEPEPGVPQPAVARKPRGGGGGSERIDRS